MRINKRLLTSLIVLGLLTLAVYGIVAIPAVFAIRQLKSEIIGQYAEIERRYAMRGLARQALDTLNQVAGRLDPLKTMSLVEGQELEFIQAMEDVATTSGVNQNLQLETVNQRELSPWEKEVPIKLTVAGTFPQILEYMQRLDALPYYLEIRHIQMLENLHWSADMSGPVRLDLQGAVYWMSQDMPVFSRVNQLLNSD